jgi:ribosome-associated protein
MEKVKDMARIVYRALEDKKGEDICIIDISGISPLADYFIITSGSNDSQVKALVDHVEDEMHKAGHSQIQREGLQTGNWVLLDYGDVVVHVFDTENREFYHLERIWSDGKRIESIDDL